MSNTEPAPFKIGDQVIVATECGDEAAVVRSCYDPGAGYLVTVEFADRVRYVFPDHKVSPAA